MSCAEELMVSPEETEKADMRIVQAAAEEVTLSCLLSTLWYAVFGVGARQPRAGAEPRADGGDPQHPADPGRPHLHDHG